MKVRDLPTPAAIVDHAALQHNLETMAAVLPGSRLRPHVKAHKTTGLARLQREAGHPGFTVATIREAEGMHAAGLGQDLMLANEVLDARRLGAIVADGARVILAVDSVETVQAAAAGGVREVVIDVNVGLPRCGCRPEDARSLAELARSRGLQVVGVMGYEGHLMIVEDAQQRAQLLGQEMKGLAWAAGEVGGELVSTGGTGDHAEHVGLGLATEVQAGSYLLMDSYYAKLGLPFRQALFLLGTVISAPPMGWGVLDVGLKSHGMDHGNPGIDGHAVWLVSDEHVTFANSVEQGVAHPVAVGQRLRVVPAHVDPTMSMHAAVHLVADAADDDAEVLQSWEVDLRGW
jgi:D-serine deaminase-like pyridoxal phosphate-dependent protein